MLKGRNGRTKVSVKFSIITVCLNAENTIDKTIQSVCEQTYHNYEHIIIDGKSTDTTLEKINAYREEYKDREIYIFSEADNGIYDAMNKSLRYVRGEFICFMNSGDTFYSRDILEKMSNVIKKHRQYDLFYGGAAIIWPDGTIKGQFRQFKLWDKEDVNCGQPSILMPCHQAIFASPKCFENNTFDLRYKLRAELKWFINCVLSDTSMYDVEFPVCRYVYGGMSEFLYNMVKSKKERDKVLEESGLCVNKYELKNRNNLLETELSKWLAIKQENRQLKEYFIKKNYDDIAIYGYGVLGNFLITELQNSNIQIKYLIDREKKYEIHNIPVCFPDDKLKEVDAIVVTAVEHFEEIYNRLREKVQWPIISLDDILEEIWYI